MVYMRMLVSFCSTPATLNLRKVCHSVDEVINGDLARFVIFGHWPLSCFITVKTE